MYFNTGTGESSKTEENLHMTQSITDLSNSGEKLMDFSLSGMKKKMQVQILYEYLQRNGNYRKNN